MGTKSRIGAGVVLKQFVRLARHPWIGTKLAALEVEKWLFPLLYPNANGGFARRIRQVSIRITDRCNLRCHTCGQWGDEGFLHGQDLRALMADEVTPARYLEVLEDLVRHRHRPLLYLWGGEPMLYQGALQVIQGATDLGLPTSIATNGTRIAALAQDLVAAPLFLLQISIDGHTAELHNSLRPGVAGADNFADIVKGLAAVRAARRERGTNLPLIASLTTISQNNHRHLLDIYESFRDKVDLFVFYLSWWIDPQNARAHDADFEARFGFKPALHWSWQAGWKPADYAELNRQLESVQAASRPWTAPPVVLIPPVTGTENLHTYYTDHQARFGFDRCQSIFQVVEVNSNGDLSPCRDYHDYVVGNLKDATITQLWNSEPYRQFRQSLDTQGLMPVCSRCCGLMGY
jgi:radical SAM protein with 4Fe4S-binding SPASM domain